LAGQFSAARSSKARASGDFAFKATEKEFAERLAVRAFD
jgi:hypothetical protein